MIIDYFEDCLALSASPSTEFTLSVAERAQGFGLFRASLPATAKEVNPPRRASPKYFYGVRSCLPASRLFSFLCLFSVLD